MTAQQSETAPRAANRVLLPVPGLDVRGIWQVGPVTFHPAADGRILAEAMVHEHGRPGTLALRTMLTVCSPAGELLRAATPAPGATADVTAARKAGIAAMLTSVIGVFADLGYPGWDKAVITGRRRPRGKELTAAQRAANRLRAQLRCAGERGSARLKYWKVISCSPSPRRFRP